MKLTPEQLGEYAPEVDTTQLSGLQQALKLAADGWHVFPLQSGKKEPLFPVAHKRGTPDAGKCRGECGREGHGAWDGTTDLDRIRKWWGAHPTAGIGANLGDDRIAFDVDLQHDGQFFQAFPPTKRHLSGRGNGNAHLIYRYTEASLAAQLRSGNGDKAGLGAGNDIKTGRGSYIVMPGSRHPETGKMYTVDLSAGLEEHILTDDEVQMIYDEAGKTLSATARAAGKGISVVAGGQEAPRARPASASGVTTLSELLQNPPSEGGRNDWLTRVAGHYAKMHREKRDLYEVEVRRANELLRPPLDTHEVEKTLESIWMTEVEAHPERGATLQNGWLVGNGRGLLCQVSHKEGEETVYELAPYADFDIEARGVAVGEMNQRAYWIRLLWKGLTIDCTLDGALLGDDRAIRRWLAGYGATIDQPMTAWPKTAPGVRLQRYIESQNPPTVHIEPTLGWHEELGVFVTHDGVITPAGPATKEEAGIVADPQLIERDLAPYHYGFDGDEREAVEVLREVLTFQTPEVTRVFGAWWAACLLKPQIQTQVSIFPFLGIEAASESGKTNGFFSLMVALQGNTRGQIAPTKPVLRDSASANRNGVVWADDLDDLSAYGEILRASTSNGTASKMDMDRNGIRNTQIVAPILISGEQLGMSNQKALADRAVVLGVQSPTGRKSLHNPKRSQWDDVTELVGRYPGKNGLAVLAGHLVAMALARSKDTLAVLSRIKGTGKGRHGDKVSVLVAGAHLLDSLLGAEGAWEGKGETVREVLAWADANQGGLTADNTLTTEILPWALRAFHSPDAPELKQYGRLGDLVTPVFVVQKGEPDLVAENGAEVWISSVGLSDAWARNMNNRVDQRTATKTALQQQADRVCVEGSSRVFKVQGTGKTARFRMLLPEYARVVLARAEG